MSAHLLGIGSLPTQLTPNIDMETYELFLRGKFHLSRLADGMRQGMECLQEVIRRAPAYAPAYAQLAMAHGMLTMYCVLPPRTGFPLIRSLCEQAIALDPNLASGHATLGSVAFWFDWDWKMARLHFERALALDPNDPMTHIMAAYYWCSLGEYAEADRMCERAIHLDPMNPAIMTVKATAKYLARQWEETLAVSDAILALDRTSWEGYRLRGLGLRGLGRLAEAVESLASAVQYSNRHPWALSPYAITLAAHGRLEEGLAIEEELRQRAKLEYIPPMSRPVRPVLNHDADELFVLLEESYESHDFWMVQLRTEPVFDPFRADPRLEEMAKRVGIPGGPD